MAKIRCARIDGRGVYMGMVEIEETEAGPEHLLAITTCDLPAGEARWERDSLNPFGGAFVPLPKAQRAKAGRPTLEQAVAFDLLERWERGEPVNAVALAWLDDMLESWDMRAFLQLNSVLAYGRARGLPFAKEEG